MVKQKKDGKHKHPHKAVKFKKKDGTSVSFKATATISDFEGVEVAPKYPGGIECCWRDLASITAVARGRRPGGARPGGDEAQSGGVRQDVQGLRGVAPAAAPASVAQYREHLGQAA